MATIIRITVANVMNRMSRRTFGAARDIQ